jgi:hypothetical protein
MLRRLLPLALAACALASCSSGRGNDDAAKEKFCTLLKDKGADIDTQVATVESKQQALQTAGELLATAPRDIKDDFQTIHDVIAAAASIDPADQDAVSKVLQLALKPDVVAAARRFDTYSREQCGVDLNADAAASTGTDTGASTTTVP